MGFNPHLINYEMENSELMPQISEPTITKLERPQTTFGRLQRIIPKVSISQPAEKGNRSKGVPEASGPQNDGKQLCPPGKPSTSEKINKTSGPKSEKHVWTHRLRERKQPVIYEEISDPEEDDE
ncbi:protein SSX7-like [Trachypithecus francoisi]|uniref:protein SSX7-like n=1 Tax=Trachypithecus francoisi TaxID=54180 RepID=UPI00141A9B5D|nr:protein SSX7-like [Trachypithecus francoisi]